MGSPKKYFFLLLLFCGSVQCSTGQSLLDKTIDSLQSIVNNATADSVRLYHLNKIGYYLSLKNDMEGARELAEKVLQQSKNLGYKLGEAEALNNLALYHWGKEDLGKATEEFNNAVSINEGLGNNNGLTGNHINLGNIHYVRGNFMEAIKEYKIALKYSELGGDRRNAIILNNNIGDAFAQQGNYTEALKYLFASLKQNSNAVEKDLYAMCSMNIGDVYKKLKNYPEALKYFNIAKENYREFGLEGYVGECVRFIGEVYEKQGNYEEALKNYLESKRIYVASGGSLVLVCNNLGRIYTHMSKFTEAHDNFNYAIKKLKRLEDNPILIETYTGMGEAFEREAGKEKNTAVRQKKYQQAIHVLNQALSIAKEKGIKESEKEVYRILANVYSGMNDYQKALAYQQLFSEVSDSLLNSENAHKMEQLRTQYEVENALTDEKLKQEEKLAQQKIARKRKEDLLIAGFTIFIIVFILVGLMLRERNQKRTAIEKAEAGHKMAELELQSLRAQLNPHFMFNSLNAIQDLILKEDNHRSHLYLSRFAKLLRVLLDNATQPFVLVKQEMEFLELYLSLENLRIPDLQVSLDKDPALNMEERMVPNMMLQPYIENAIWHGLSGKKGERKLRIRIYENVNATEFEIEDNGIGREKAAAIKAQYKQGHHSKGMELLSKRFGLLSSEYGEAIDVSVTDLYDNGEARGTLVKISVPFNLSEQARISANDTNHHS
ncbi:MAG: tetratricopeptide repeat protein [Ferruginibacter sp.]